MSDLSTSSIEAITPPARPRFSRTWWIILAVITLMTAAVVHVAAVAAAPKVIMRAAIQRISGDGRAINRWVFGPRVTAASRGVVRPSPDLAYATCVYDLAKGPVRVTAEPSSGVNAGDYMSVSVYDAATDNIYAVNDRQAPQGADFVLALKGQAAPRGAKVVISPSRTGIVLDRRLAPTPERFAPADQARRGNSCGPVGMDFPAVPKR